ncbi:1895_t:CDS:2 [Funneliformis mosseae]|uniref:1895_t:CDS:1 n=1 Tax=Funneliformis mosseae TaxID=27381 RepID=A0A9N9ET49_FUNMO|nr:1895_t:CDS:2 [Funneliformis mosseae]
MYELLVIGRMVWLRLVMVGHRPLTDRPFNDNCRRRAIWPKSNFKTNFLNEIFLVNLVFGHVE